MELKAIIFDLDGVIVDTAKFHYKAWRALANDLGFDLTKEQNEQLKGVSRMESLDIILSIGGIDLSLEKKTDLAAQKNANYQDMIKSLEPSDMLPGVDALIRQIKEAKLAMGLGSASKNARTILEYIGIRDQFDVIVDGTNITRAKPDPQVFELGADEMDVPHNHVMVVEDSISGIQAANKAGMFSLGIGEEHTLHMADWVLPGFDGVDLAQLKNIFSEKRNDKDS